MERKVERGRRKHQVILIIWQRIVLHVSTAVQATDRHYCGSCATRTSKCVAIHSCELILRIHEMVGLLAGATKSHCGYDQYKAGAGTKSRVNGRLQVRRWMECRHTSRAGAVGTRRRSLEEGTRERLSAPASAQTRERRPGTSLRAPIQQATQVNLALYSSLHFSLSTCLNTLLQRMAAASRSTLPFAPASVHNFSIIRPR